jgi:flavin reductase (DIM6/NTAB) family NADH-FMN oxidoreductase RutF
LKESVALSTFHHLLHPYPTSLVTCCTPDGERNIIAIAWMIPVSVRPPRVAIAIRSERYSYNLIRSMDEFVINVAPYELAAQVLYCGRHSGQHVDKFAATNLKAGQARLVTPPIIQECLAFIECRLVENLDVGDHRLIVGEVVAAYVQPNAVDADGLYDLQVISPLLHLGRNRFVTTRKETIEPALAD